MEKRSNKSSWLKAANGNRFLIRTAFPGMGHYTRVATFIPGIYRPLSIREALERGIRVIQRTYLKDFELAAIRDFLSKNPYETILIRTLTQIPEAITLTSNLKLAHCRGKICLISDSAWYTNIVYLKDVMCGKESISLGPKAWFILDKDTSKGMNKVIDEILKLNK